MFLGFDLIAMELDARSALRVTSQERVIASPGE
jgi:hypothetical protein